MCVLVDMDMGIQVVLLFLGMGNERMADPAVHGCCAFRTLESATAQSTCENVLCVQIIKFG